MERENINRLLGVVCVNACPQVTAGCASTERPQRHKSCPPPQPGREVLEQSPLEAHVPLSFYHTVFLNHHHNHVKYAILSPLIYEENDPKMDDILS